MQYILTTGREDGVASLAERLGRELMEGKKVLWLVCGGSNIPASVQVMKNVAGDLTPRLSIMLTDERYGEAGHKDSNWQQLQDAGFDFKQARQFPILTSGQNLEETIQRYQELTKDAFGATDIIIAQFGIGADGHIAGILPNSPAAAENELLAAGYEADPFTRLTLTFPALRHIETAYAFAFGESKKAALTALKSKNMPPAEQPSQILKELSEAYVYSDQIGEHP